MRKFDLRLACYIEGACGIMLPSDVHSVFWIALLFPCVDAVVFDTASKQLCALPQCAKKLRLVDVRECHGCRAAVSQHQFVAMSCSRATGYVIYICVRMKKRGWRYRRSG